MIEKMDFMTTTVTIEVNSRTKAGKAFLALVDTILKNQTGIKVKEGGSGPTKKIGKKRFIEEMAKKVNKATAKKWYEESNIEYQE